MRFLTTTVAAFACINLVVLAEVADDDDEDWSKYEQVEADEDFDSGDLDEAPADYVQDTTLAESVDAELSEDQRQVRMALCIGVVRQKYDIDREEITKRIPSLAKLQGIKEEEVANAIHMNMLSNCYLNLNQDSDLPELADSGKFDAAASRVVGPPAGGDDKKSYTLLPRQWELVGKFLEDEKKGGNKKKSEPKVAKIEVPGSGMNAFQKFLYFVSVFGAIFGGGYMLIRKMISVDAMNRNPVKAKKASKKTN
jgi:hypothetical protein